MKVAADVSRALVRHWVLAPGQFSAEFEFLPEMEIFQGHFPGHPIVPGIYLLHCLLLTSEQGLGRPVRLKNLKQAKFIHPVTPPCRIQANVQVTDIGQGLGVRGEIKDQGKIAASAAWEGE